MSHIVARTILESQTQFNQSIPDYEVLRFDGDGRKKKHQSRIWEEHSKCQQDAKDSP